MVGIYGGILLATALGFLLAFYYLPHATAASGYPSVFVLTGLAITAYILGARHGFDADHIAAIDNTTRKLLHEGQRPLTVGTWFSLGHSTIVGGMVVALVLATQYIASHVATFESIGTVVGAAVSGVFLFLIGLLNVFIVLDIYRIFREVRHRRIDEQQLEEQLEKRGFLYRYFGKLFRLIERPWQIYPIGVLFGLGFDTATEVILIGISVGVGLSGSVPLWAILILPLLFTCGMVLSDTTDGFAMRYAYGWAFRHPIRKIYYNLTLTIISVLVAFVVGGVELLQVLARTLGWNGLFWGWLGSIDFEWLGIGIAVLFVAAWLIAMAIYRLKRFEEIGFPEPAPIAP